MYSVCECVLMCMFERVGVERERESACVFSLSLCITHSFGSILPECVSVVCDCFQTSGQIRYCGWTTS